MGVDTFFLFRVKSFEAFMDQVPDPHLREDLLGPPLAPDVDDEDDERVTGRLGDGAVLVYSCMRFWDFNEPRMGWDHLHSVLGPDIARHLADPRGVFVFPDGFDFPRNGYEAMTESLNDCGRFVRVDGEAPPPMTFPDEPTKTPREIERERAERQLKFWKRSGNALEAARAQKAVDRLSQPPQYRPLTPDEEARLKARFFPGAREADSTERSTTASSDRSPKLRIVRDDESE
ncbi:MAG: hypothetical protein JNG84_14430 [Archangium sp.]|nr:hypothetical protein [Archangium sp.]